MKNKAFRAKQLKEQLRRLENEGKKELLWSLSQDKLEFIERLGYYTEPYLYEIHTRKFYNISSIKSELLKQIHYKNKSGKATYVRRLNHSQRKLLDDYGIKYKVAKYKIYLRRN